MVALSVLDWATVGDVNGDLYPDIYISNDFTKRIIYTSIIKMEPLPNK
jgi:hypothetical protein